MVIGDRGVCALMANGVVRCWGQNDCTLGIGGSPGGWKGDPAMNPDVQLFYPAD